MSANAHLQGLITRFPELSELAPTLDALIGELVQAFSSGRRLYICGNGGSAADAEHIAGEMLKRFEKHRPIPEALKAALAKREDKDSAFLIEKLEGGLPALALTGAGPIATAIANDTDGSLVFAQQLVALGQEGDFFLGISTSGNSRNVVLAMKVASALGMRTVSLTGKPGGELNQLAEFSLAVPGESTARIQEYHLPVYHVLCAAVEDACFA